MTEMLLTPLTLGRTARTTVQGQPPLRPRDATTAPLPCVRIGEPLSVLSCRESGTVGHSIDNGHYARSHHLVMRETTTATKGPDPGENRKDEVSRAAKE